MTRSHCPKCDAEIKAWQNIPIVSWLILMGKCKNCKNPISIQYPIVEALTSVFFGVVAWRITTLELEYFPTLLALVGVFAFVFTGVVLSIIDIKTQTLSIGITYTTLAIIVLSLSLSSVLTGDYWSVVRAAIGAAALSILYFIIWYVRPGWMGFGDVRLAIPIGFILAWFSWETLVFGFFAPYMIAALYVIPQLISKKMKSKTPIPFGPWMILGTIVAIAWGDSLVNLYLQFGGVS